MPFCVLIWRRTINVPIGMTNITLQATPNGKETKIVTIAAIEVAMAGAKSIKSSFRSFTVPSRLRLSRPWILPVIWLRK